MNLVLKLRALPSILHLINQALYQKEEDSL